MDRLKIVKDDAGVRHLARTVVYVLGVMFGLSVAATADYFGGVLLIICVALALCVAAPVCWVLASRSAWRDRWTIGYAIIWISIIGASYVVSSVL